MLYQQPMADNAHIPDAGPMIAEVILPLALDHPYSYRVPAGMMVRPGDCVTVPLSTRETFGLVLKLTPGAGDNLKPILGLTGLPLMRAEMREFIRKVAGYTLAPLGLVAKMAMLDPDQAREEKPRFGVRLTGKAPARPTPARARLIAAATGGLLHPKRALAEAAGCTTGVIDALVDEGVFEVIPLSGEAQAEVLDGAGRAPTLSLEQGHAAQKLVAAVAAQGFGPILLEGVTGSGKTEVYFEAVVAALSAGRQVLILLPEIALTPEFLTRFEARFGGKPGAWHSGISPARRNRLWHGVADGMVKVVVGARSALFLPFSNLGLIIVDEEHEAAFKQDDLVRYHARDMAVLRAKIETCPVILASATPSIESRVNAAQGRYAHVLLPNRAGGRVMPDLAAIDLTIDPPQRGAFLSPGLIREAKAVLERGEQVMFFLNRRGYAPLTLCRACGHRWQCPDCDAWLVEHRFRRGLICHHCGHIERRPNRCVACDAEESLVACGPGVERIAEEVAEAFPDHRRIVLSSDFPGGTERLKAELAAVARGDFPVLIGTQLLAKGHNFPRLTLAAVVDADIGLVSNDPRAAERTFQLLTQVTGRAGRGETPGRGLLQTFQPKHPVIAALLSGDEKRFYAAEIAAREAAMMPPFGRLASLLVSARQKEASEGYARLLARVGHELLSAKVTPSGLPLRGGHKAGEAIQKKSLDRRVADAPRDDGVPHFSAPDFSSITLLGPAEAPLAYLRGKFRFRLIVKAPRNAPMHAFIRALREKTGAPKGGARLDVDIDPMSFY